MADGGSQSGPGSFDRILDRLDRLGRLPRRVSDRNALTREYELLDQRHLRLVEAIMTGGDGTAAGIPPIQEVQARHEKIMAATAGELPYFPQSGPVLRISCYQLSAHRHHAAL